MYKKYIDFKIIIFLITGVISLQVYAEPWNIPADKKAQNSNLIFNDATAKEGEAIYTKNCVSCHGNPGQGNSLQSLNPIPPDLATKGTQDLTDGELFYILNNGRSLMPSFKNVLSADERWKVISYLRGFNKEYVQTVSKTDPEKGKLVNVKTTFDAATNKVNVTVKANEPTGIVSLADVEIVLFAKRYFGRMQIDKTMRTDKDGLASFEFPKDLPGDKQGNVGLVVKVNSDVYGEVESSDSLKIGVPTDVPSLTEKRAIWNVMAKAPYWIIFAYLFGVTVVTAVFLYIFYTLYKLWKKGTN